MPESNQTTRFDDVQREMDQLFAYYESLVRRIETLSAEDRQRALFELVAHPRWFWPLCAPYAPAGIDRSNDVCGNSARIVRTRIPVWTLVQLRRQGMSESELLANFPSLRAEDLVHAWSYADVHPEEIDAEIRENEE